MGYRRVLESPVAKGLITDFDDADGFSYIIIDGKQYSKTKKLRIHLAKMHKLIVEYSLKEIKL